MKDLISIEKIKLFIENVYSYFFFSLNDEKYLSKSLKFIEKEIKKAFKLKDIIQDEKVLIDKIKKEIKDLKSLINEDLDFYYASDPAALDTFDIKLSYPGFKAVFIYRISHILYELEIPYIPRMLQEYSHTMTGIDINPGAKIGKSLFIDHGTGVVIGETAIIGDYVKMYHGVTLGALSLTKGQSLKGTKRHPTIGNRVTIYSNTSILGGDTVIGDNVIIGSNVVLQSSVEANSIVKVNIKNIEITKKN